VRLNELICIEGEGKYFCKRGWTANSLICPSGKSVDAQDEVERNDTHHIPHDSVMFAVIASERRSNPSSSSTPAMDCFASLAMTVLNTG
jgi:hypothetical protein